MRTNSSLFLTLIDTELGQTAFHCWKTVVENFPGVIVMVNGLRHTSDELLAFELGRGRHKAFATDDLTWTVVSASPEDCRSA